MVGSFEGLFAASCGAVQESVVQCSVELQAIFVRSVVGTINVRIAHGIVLHRPVHG